MGITVGIDLGTTNSVVAQYKKGKIKVIENNQDSDTLTPSVVHITEHNEVVVGKLAKTLSGVDARNTVFSIKRFMGRNFDDPEIQQDIEKAPYQVEKAANGEVDVILRGRRFSPPEISAFILEALKVSAEDSTGQTVEHAVITVPAYFGNRQKEATRLAGDLAGLNVMTILPEPTAAALTYGTGSEESGVSLVYDLGGGTFDVTVMEISPGVFDDIGKSGDWHLGGDNFDHVIMDWIVKQTKVANGVDLVALNDKNVLYRLKEAAEQTKIRLSRLNRTQIVIPDVTKVNGRSINIELDLTVEEFNQMIEPMVAHSIDLVHEAIKRANYTENDIERILLVGGSTKVPVVVKALKNMFGDKVIHGDLNPMHCVAEGAAIQTNLPIPDQNRSMAAIIQCEACGTRNLKDRPDCRKCGKPMKGFAVKPNTTPDKSTIVCPECQAVNPQSAEQCEKCHHNFAILLQRIPVPIGVEVMGGEMKVVLDEKMYYPIKEPEQRLLRTTQPNQLMVRLPIYEGWDVANAKNNTFLGEVVGELPSGLSENAPVNVMLSIDNDGILSVRVNLPDHLEVDIKAEIKWKDRGPAPVAPIGKGGSGSGGTAVKTWEEECEFTTMIAGIILREGEEGLSKQDYSRIKDLMDRLDQARKSGNKSSAVALKPQLEEENNGFFFFIVLVLGRMMAQDPTTTTKVGLTKANQLADAVTEADRYKQQRNYPAMLKVIKDRIEPIVLSDDLLGNNTGAGGGINLAGLLKQ